MNERLNDTAVKGHALWLHRVAKNGTNGIVDLDAKALERCATALDELVALRAEARCLRAAVERGIEDKAWLQADVKSLIADVDQLLTEPESAENAGTE